MTAALLATKKAAEYIGMSAAFLERDRWAGPTIPFVRLGTRSVRYRQEDLDAFIEARITQANKTS